MSEALDQKALEAAIAVLAEHGIDIRMPWECDLDDLERERFDAISGAIRAYLSAALRTAGAAEPAAWRGVGEDNVSDVTERADIAAQWEADGITVRPLVFASPPSDTEEKA